MNFSDLTSAIEKTGCNVDEMDHQDFTDSSSGHSEYYLKKAEADRP